VIEPSHHLFRREAGRMVSTLTRIFGVHNLALAEDVVQDAFCRALEVWKFRGVPENPSAWLMATAKNRALDVLRRERTARTFAPELGRLLGSEWTVAPVIQDLFGANAIKDDQLRMMFSCCHPRLPKEAQVVLMLHILCGFTVNEVASAFVSSHAAIEKRISRAKKVLADRRGCSIYLARTSSPGAFQPCSVHCTCSSTKATTVRLPSRPCERNSARRRFVSRRSFSNTHSGRRRRRTLWAHSCVSTQRVCQRVSMRRAT
jgi:RNA polymerase sigma factor (sigma-70 family)